MGLLRRLSDYSASLPLPDFEAPLKSTLQPTRGWNIAPTFTRNSTATVMGFGPSALPGDSQILLTVGVNEARFEGARRISEGVWSDKYADGTPIPDATLKGYVAEGSRTNLFLNSEIGATQNITVSAQNYTLSFFGTGSILITGTATGTLNGTGVNNRVNLTITPSAGVVILTVTGSITKVQFEAGNFASSYIPTTSASVTRNGDVLTYPTAGNVDGAKGSAYAEVMFHQSIPSGVESSYGNNIILDVADNRNLLQLYDGYQFLYDGTTPPATLAWLPIENTKYKIASKYGGSTSRVFRDGASGSGSFAFDGNMNVGSEISVGSKGVSYNYHVYGTIRNVKVWKKALKDRHLLELTK